MKDDLEKMFDEMKKRYGSHAEAAKALGVPVRTYLEYRSREYRRDSTRRKIESLVKLALAAPCVEAEERTAKA